ncbi:MAG: helix-turn-helix transcriptional regulator [Armatimonadetes bacterium]|nr:helix-turn-helix transcriptional regulator [Armatimonadota bacterium]
MKIVATFEQLECLASLARREVYYAFLTYGDLTVKQLSEKMGRPTKSLYYPVRQLVQCGLLEVAETHRVAKRTEATYRATSDEIDLPPADPRNLKVISKSMRLTLRRALGDVNSLRTPEELNKVFIDRSRIRMSAEVYREVCRLIMEAIHFAKEHSDPQAEEFSMLVLGLPTPRDSSRGK